MNTSYSDSIVTKTYYKYTQNKHNMDPITQKLIELNPKRRKYAISYLLENYEKGRRGKVVGQLIELCGEGMRLATFHKIRGLKIGDHGSMRGDHILLMMDFFGIQERKYFELYNANDLNHSRINS